MDTSRRNAVVAGVLFIIATAADVISRVVFVQPVLGASDYLTELAASEGQVLLGALLLLIGAAAAGGIAIALYPVLRKHNEGLGSVGFRLIEAGLYVGIVVCLLLLVTLSQGASSPGSAASSAYSVSAALLVAAHDSLAEVAVLVFGLGALLYYLVFYQSRLIPRWLSAWGLVAIVSVMVSGLLVLLRLTEPMSPTQLVLALPIAVQEMVMAVWLIAKGFSPSALAAAPGGETSTWQAAASRSAA